MEVGKKTKFTENKSNIDKVREEFTDAVSGGSMVMHIWHYLEKRKEEVDSFFSQDLDRQ